VNTEPVGADARASPRSPPQRKGPVIMMVIGAILAVGAFLLWGPIGLGNGPVNAGIGATEGGTDLAGGPMGFVIPIRNSGHAAAVIDGVDLINETDYAAPHLLALRVGTSEQCAGAWPTHQRPRGWSMPGICGADIGSLIGRAVSPNSGGFTATAAVGAPHPRTCWVITKIVVHYHVGIRYYSATDPYELAVCSDADLVSSAMDAIAAAGE
jgi:hypothetical protein